ncbi:GNAT family N-acetyltransferase [Thermaurantiacus sp.]
MATASEVPLVRIEPAGAEAAEAIEALSLRAFDPEYREAWSARQVAQVALDPGGLLDIARAGGELVGFALTRLLVHEAELLLCAVDPAWRRRGIASRLVAASAARAGRSGARRLLLEVRESNAPARRLYETLGFRPVGVRPDYYRSATGLSIAAVTLSRTIDPRQMS